MQPVLRAQVNRLRDQWLPRQKDLWLQKKKQIAIVGVGVALILAGWTYFAQSGTKALLVDGKALGVVTSKKAVSQTVDVLLAEARQKYGPDVTLAGRLQYRPASLASRGGSRPPVAPGTTATATTTAPGAATATASGTAVAPSTPDPSAAATSTLPLLDPENMKTVLAANLPIMVMAAVIVSDGKDAVALKDTADAKTALDNLKLDYEHTLLSDDDGTKIQSISFKEKVNVTEKRTKVIAIKTVEQAKAVLLRGTDEVKEHQVANDESLWSIAMSNNISVESLYKANPELKGSDLIHPGQKLSLVVAAPYVNLKSLERRVYTEGIPYSTNVVEDSSRWPWEQVVSTPGKYGQRLITKDTERENGLVTATRIVESKVLSEPTTQVLLQGTKIIPDRGTGSFVWPASGSISSPFGWRPGEFHTGIDIAASYGTAVRAADSGTVVQVLSDYWGYGKQIVIDHGSGKTLTRYAHLSAFAARVGQGVERGQVIGYVGSTGRSTGPHLHFEVIVGGKAVNPVNYYPR